MEWNEKKKNLPFFSLTRSIQSFSLQQAHGEFYFMDIEMEREASNDYGRIVFLSLVCVITT